MAKLGVEKTAVQAPLVGYSEAAGWTHLPRAEAERLRRGTDKPFLHEVLVRQLQPLNPGVVDLARAGRRLPALGSMTHYLRTQSL